MLFLSLKLGQPDGDVGVGHHRIERGAASTSTVRNMDRVRAVPLGWLSSVATPMESAVQIEDPPFKVHGVIMPRFAVDSWCSLFLEV